MRAKPGLVGAKGDQGPQGLVSLNQVTDQIGITLQVTAIGIATALLLTPVFNVAGYNALGDSGAGGQWMRVADSVANPLPACMKVRNVASGSWYVKTVLGKTIDIGHLGAMEGDRASAVAACQAAVATTASRISIPGGTYYIDSVFLPDHKFIGGQGKSATLVVAVNACDYVFSIGAGSNAADMTVNGNLLATKCFDIAGDYVGFSDIHVQFASYGFFNNGHNSTGFTRTSDDNCHAGIYTVDQFINGFITNHQSRGGSYYGFYATYSTQQPQTINFQGCLFFGNTYGVWIDKDAYVVNFLNSYVDGCTGTGIRMGPGPASAAFGMSGNCYISALGIPIDVAPGVDRVLIRDTDVGNGVFNIRIQATTTSRSRMVVLDGLSVGQSTSGGLSLDTPLGCTVRNSLFAPVGGPDIVTPRTYTGSTAGDTLIVVEDCLFQRNNIDAGSFQYLDVHRCIGVKTKKRGIATFSSGGTTAYFDVGDLAILPRWAAAEPFGDVGVYWDRTGTLTSGGTTYILFRTKGAVPAPAAIDIGVYCQYELAA